MKKLVLFAVVAIMSVTVSQAQEIRLGAKGGVNFATLGGDDIGDIKSRTGFHIGGLVEIPITESFWIQPEVLYSAQGAKYEERGQELGVPYSIKGTIKLDYIQVPVMAKYYVVEGLAIEAGPQIAFLAKSTGKVESSVGGISYEDEDDIDDISKIDFSLGVGASYRMDMGLFVGARYNFGLSNVNDGSFSDDIKLHNNVFQVSLGYSF